MITWEWTREHISADDMLDAAKSIDVTQTRLMIDLTRRWTSARTLLSWAAGALQRGGDDGWDAAAGWAKRAVCRQMDGILAHNHLSSVLGKNYKEKAKYLGELKVPGLALLRDLVIDPRNDIEHAYASASEDHARRAYEVAELFLGATDDAANVVAVIALGWDMNYREYLCVAPGRERHTIELGLSKENSPMLLIDYYAEQPHVLVLLPQQETLCLCPLSDFKTEQLIALNSMLRECLKSTSFSSRHVSAEVMKQIKDQLKF